MNFSAAFQCAKCPQNGNPELGPACPCWWETIQDDGQGRQRVVRACAWVQLPHFLIHFARTNTSAAAAVESTRNEIVEGFVELGRTIRETAAFLPNLGAEKQRLRGPSTALPGSNQRPPADSGSE